jgi:hypothetical protein
MPKIATIDAFKPSIVTFFFNSVPDAPHEEHLIFPIPKHASQDFIF